MNFRTEIVKSMLLIVTVIIAFGSIVARADGIDTEHLFGFTIGTDIGEFGEKELESNLLSRFGKRAGSYSALSQVLSLEYTANQNLRLEVSAVGVHHDIAGVPKLDDRRRGVFDGLSFDIRYRIFDRANAPFRADDQSRAALGPGRRRERRTGRPVRCRPGARRGQGAGP
jgi:hypothetical protein